MGGVNEGRAVPTAGRQPHHGSDFLQLAVGDVPAGGKTEWLAGRLRQAIADGRLTVGGRLPPTRVLAAELRVSRGVVTEAYRRLAEDGQVEGRRRGGTVVVAAPYLSPAAPGGAAPRSSGGPAWHSPESTASPSSERPPWHSPGSAASPTSEGPAWHSPESTASGGASWRSGRGAAAGGANSADSADAASGGAANGGTEGAASQSAQGAARQSGEPTVPGTHLTGVRETAALSERTAPGTQFPGVPGAGTHSDPTATGTHLTGVPGAGTHSDPTATGIHLTAVPDTAAPSARGATGTLFAGVPGAGVFDALRAAPATVDLTPGRPDLATFPRAAWLRAERAVLAELSAGHLGYGDPRGAPRLRRAVADWLARMRGVRVEPDEVLIVAGTAQALTLLHPVLRADGIEGVAVEDPGSLGARQHLRNGGLATPPVPVDEDGVRVDALRATGARAVLLTPAHQFPTGVVTSGERRRELLGWARDGGLILEDDYDAEHRYDRPPVPALRALLADRVCYMGSVSKLLAPALRTGWLVAPPRYRAGLIDAKRFNDLGNAVLPQLVLARLMESGELERHLRLLRGRHRRRRDAMIAALAEHLPGGVVHGAAAGLHLTVTYAADVPDTEVAEAALARGVKCQPLSWHRQLPGHPGLVLGYAATPPGVIAEGVALLGRTLRELSGT